MPRLPKALQVQAQAAAILGATLDLPGTSLLGRRSKAPAVVDAVVAGTASTIVRPGGSPPWPTLVFVNGATPDGRAHPTVLRLGAALARSGVLVFIPDLPGIAGGELSPATLAASVAFVDAAASSTESARGQAGLAGVSVGASLALLTAADPRLAARISVVACVAPYTDMANVMLLATTGTYRTGSAFEPYSVPEYLWVGLARSVIAILPATPGIETLNAELRALDPAAPDPASHFRDRSFDELGEEAVSVLALLTNDEPARFDDLFDALPVHVRATVEALSPLHAAPGLRARVEIVTAPRDRYFPVAESRALAAASPHVRLTVTSLLTHATPRLHPRYLAELGQLDGFFVRSLRALD